MILLLSGTKDGRLLAEALEQGGCRVLATAVSEYGEFLLRESFGGDVLSEALNEERMKQVVREKKISLVIDATHPFAVNASRNAMQVCEAMELEYIRFERESIPKMNHPNVIQVEDIPGAVAEARKVEGNIFLTVGSNSLETFVQALGVERLVVRVLPTAGVIKKCEDLGIKPRNIIAMQGPFDKKLNIEMIRHYNAQMVISKESGNMGGVQDKIEAAESLGIPLILIHRPTIEYKRVFSNIEDLVADVLYRLNDLERKESK